MSMNERDPMQLIPLAAGPTLTVEPTESGFQMELWFTDRGAIVSIPLTRPETSRLVDALNDALGAGTE